MHPKLILLMAWQHTMATWPCALLPEVMLADSLNARASKAAFLREYRKLPAGRRTADHNAKVQSILRHDKREREFLRERLKKGRHPKMNSEQDFDVHQLRGRGWTLGMIEAFLQTEDYRAPVDHFFNFAGKKMFGRWRVEAAEASESFRIMFQRSVRRRRLPKPFVKEVLNRSR